MLKEIEGDCRSTTGRNLRNLKLLSQNLWNEKIEVEKEPYHKLPEGSEWKMILVKEIVSIKSGELKLGNIVYNDLDDILEIVCS